MSSAATSDSDAASQLGPAEFFFECDADAESVWRPVHFDITEGLSELYRAVIVLACEDEAADPELLLGQSALLRIERSGDLRQLPGVISRIEDLGTSHPHRIIRIELVPALWALSKRVDTRIFQGATAPKVLEAVINAGLKPFKRTVKVTELSRTYPSREYCVQYDETDLDFCLRLMEEEGIAFAFDSSDTKEVMVLLDADHPYLPMPGWEQHPVEIARAEALPTGRETLRRFHPMKAVGTEKVVVRDFDWTRPALQVVHSVKASDASAPDARESYLGASELTWSGFDGTAFAGDDGKDRAQLRLDMHRASQSVVTGEGNVRAFSPGHVFKISGHARAELDVEYALIRVRHQGVAEEELPSVLGLVREEDPPDRYRNTFECIPADRPYRPPLRTRRPRITGVQSAKVVGPSGQEIYTDVHGRIKVQFPWDRKGSNNEKSSCFVRVAQSLAGAGWGAVFLPRIGMEVLVQFLDGNPDRPVVLGCLYNGETPTPYGLPGEASRTTLRTNSTPGGGGYNELSFEDNAGSEEVHLQAQRNLRILVKNDKDQEVQGKETLKVVKDRSKTVDGNQMLKVKGNDLNTVGGNHGLDVGGDDSLGITGNQATTVGGNQNVGVGGNRASTVSGFEQLNVVGANNVNVGAAMSLNVGGVLAEVVGGARTVVVGGLLSENVVGNASLKTGGSIDRSAKGSYSMSAKGDATLSSKKNIETTAAKKHGMKAKTMEIEVKESFLLKVGKASIELKQNGDVVIKGGKMLIEGTGDTVVKGKNVKLN